MEGLGRIYQMEGDKNNLKRKIVQKKRTVLTSVILSKALYNRQSSAELGDIGIIFNHCLLHPHQLIISMDSYILTITIKDMHLFQSPTKDCEVLEKESFILFDKIYF